jgi:hypothetical protein
MNAWLVPPKLRLPKPVYLDTPVLDQLPQLRLIKRLCFLYRI